jgi:hypothetical protein
MGTPRTTNSFLLLASADVKEFHYDTNVFLTELVQGTVPKTITVDAWATPQLPLCASDSDKV